MQVWSMKTSGMHFGADNLCRNIGYMDAVSHSAAYREALFRDYMARALSKTDSMVLDATILRVGSSSGRELIAWQASGGTLSCEDIAKHLGSLRDPDQAEAAKERLAGLDAGWAVRLARLMALQGFLPDDRINALDLFALMTDAASPPAISRSDARTFCDLALLLGRPNLARTWLKRFRLNKSDRTMVNADLINPFESGGADPSGWLELFNRPFAEAGMEALSLHPAEGEMRDAMPFDRMYCEAGARIDGPLVSVIVSCWKPGRALLTSVRSLLGQTWQSIEVIVVDDGSPAEYAPILEQVSKLDERVRVIRQPVNSGTYVARNKALQSATGTFVTFQDSDDWSHPRRIEIQLKFISENQDVIGVVGNLARATENLMLGVPGSSTIQEALPMLMFRRAQVVEKIGFYDCVRKSADREYIERMCAAFGTRVLSVGKAPLGVYRLSGDSLSRAEFKPGWRHAARNIYKDAFDFWHGEIAAGRARGYRSPDLEGAAFPAPREFKVDRAEVSRLRRYDFVFIGDWRQYGGPQKSMIEEISALRAAGHRVAICHQEAFRFMTKHRHGKCAPIRKLVHERVVDEVALSDDIQVGVLVLRYPPILQFVRHHPAQWDVKTAIIVVNQAPHELDGTDVRYSVADCIANFRHLFGLDASWVPQGPQVRDAIEAAVPSDLLDPRDMPGILDVDEWRMPARSDVGRRPVVGRYSRDNMMKFPGDPDHLLRCYPAVPDIDVRIMGGVQSCRAVLADRDVPENWALIPYNDIPVNAFLAVLDFFVYYDNDHIVEAFGRSVLEALASGVVVILPEKFRRVFGDSAVYAAAEDVEDLVRSIYSDRGRYRALSARSLEYVRSHFSRESYAARMAGLLAA